MGENGLQPTYRVRPVTDMTEREILISLLFGAVVTTAYSILHGVPGEGWLQFGAVILLSVSVALLIVQGIYRDGAVIAGLLGLYFLFV